MPLFGVAPNDADPRLAGARPPGDLPDNGLAVAGPARGPIELVFGAVLLLALGAGLFLSLNASRVKRAEVLLTAPTVGRSVAVAAPPPLDLREPGPPPPPAPAPQPALANLPPPSPGFLPQMPLPPPPQVARSSTSPILIVDLAPNRTAAPGSGAAGAGAQPAPSGGSAGAGGAEDLEGLMAGAGQGEDERVSATRLRNPGMVVPQGAIIPAVLETAIDSDLPGFARAIISRDVMSFDGRRVLIPGGSRLIGRYKSDLAAGQSRVFVIWTRLIRPDGASVQLDSPAADALGRGGLDGTVDRKFLDRFGGAVLMSSLNAAVSSLQGGRASQVIIGSPIGSIEGSNSARGRDIAPVVRVPHGAAVRVFVARDLDFSAVGGMGS
ncbi:MAG: TrbI/VirB10 family protein [Phenylobacterium sp.]|uniref:TrbI/VirB10 family protein n=1 Tax=Phenylobacterium sp. TaxID=1871053 RepID=UPI00273295D3|nr:TrbI/VirB10 family protein [Phenylobacterium sp.]MDP3749258.1 TrbI/VirB10 family protein [Phenylobacterium sp.]